MHFEDLCGGGNLLVNWEASPGILKPSDYVERWRIILWEKAFFSFLHPNIKPPFLKSTRLDNVPSADLAIKRLLYRFVFCFIIFLEFYSFLILYIFLMFVSHVQLLHFHFLLIFCCRYVKRELMPKNALGHSNCPPFFGAWIQPSSDLCIFTPVQLKKFSSAHLHGGGWYLECHVNFTPDEEVEFRNNIICTAPSPPVPDSEDEDVFLDLSQSIHVATEDGTSSKKKRLRKAEKEKADKDKVVRDVDEQAAAVERAVADALAKVAATNNVPLPSASDISAHVDVSGYSHLVMDSQAAGSSYMEASRNIVQSRMQRLPTLSRSSTPLHATSFESFIQNASVHSIMDSLGDPNGPPPLWTQLHDFISRVSSLNLDLQFSLLLLFCFIDITCL